MARNVHHFLILLTIIYEDVHRSTNSILICIVPSQQLYTVGVEDETARGERIRQMPLYAEAKKIKSLALQTSVSVRVQERTYT